MHVCLHIYLYTHLVSFISVLAYVFVHMCLSRNSCSYPDLYTCTLVLMFVLLSTYLRMCFKKGCHVHLNRGIHVQINCGNSVAQSKPFLHIFIEGNTPNKNHSHNVKFHTDNPNICF